MKTSLSIISIVSLLIMSTPSYNSIVSCRLLLNPETKNRVLILGESCTFDCVRDNIDQLLSGLGDLQTEITEPVNCFVELAQHHIDERETLNGITFQKLAEEIAKPQLFTNNIIRLVPCDRRGRISDQITGLLIQSRRYSGPFVSNNLDSVIKVPAPLRAYEKMINRYLSYIEWQQRVFKGSIDDKILERQRKSIIDAYLYLKEKVFYEKTENADLYETILTYLNKKCKGIQSKEHAFLRTDEKDGLWSKFIGEIDHAFANALFFCNVMQDQKGGVMQDQQGNVIQGQKGACKTPKLSILIVYEINAQKIASMFHQAGYKLVEERSSVPSIQKSESKHKADVTAVPKLIHVLIYYAPFLSHPVTEKSAYKEYLLAYKACEEKLTELRKESLKQAIDTLSVKCGTLPLSNTTCNYKGCVYGAVPESLKRCSRCKIVSYCSASCQKEDWKAHKLACKKKQSP